MSNFVHEWEHDGAIITFSWLGDVDVRADRVYAFAFTSDRKMLLVTDPKWNPACWLPGGGIEDGESPRQALARELVEEANAVVHQSAKIGIQRADSSTGARSYHAFYWCRVTLDSDFSPKHEISDRYLVTADEFLDRLLWGRKDPKAPMLLKRALEMDRSHEF
jgi:ADP-ribose pyrophosphatase YjhB (NUDIX family)